MPPSTTAGRRRGGRAVAAGVLLASLTTLLSAAAPHAATAAGAAPSVRSGAPTGKPLPVRPQGRARVTAAVLDLDGPARQPTVYGDDAPYDTASISKVDILAALLLKAQDAHRGLTAQERAYAAPMIRRSDNASANALWRRIGRAPGLAAANKRLGLTATRGGSGPRWGLTRTTASDQVRLLRAVFGTPSAAHAGSTALNGGSRAYIRTLMTHVSSDQTWGVPAASGAAPAVKNGWLQRDTSGLWDVNSVGQVGAHGHRYLVAVLSDGSASMKDGVRLVEAAARASVSSASGR
ncbi:serine hydrolase [Streptomyces sp. NPDC096152]|uniref:serine hydrolase n=1 Tax=Streptomyces sp. NPDC096152 TaxID=3366078 RepID=UPI003821A944